MDRAIEVFSKKILMVGVFAFSAISAMEREKEAEVKVDVMASISQDLVKIRKELMKASNDTSSSAGPTAHVQGELAGVWTKLQQVESEIQVLRGSEFSQQIALLKNELEEHSKKLCGANENIASKDAQLTVIQGHLKLAELKIEELRSNIEEYSRKLIDANKKDPQTVEVGLSGQLPFSTGNITPLQLPQPIMEVALGREGSMSQQLHTYRQLMGIMFLTLFAYCLLDFYITRHIPFINCLIPEACPPIPVCDPCPAPQPCPPIPHCPEVMPVHCPPCPICPAPLCSAPFQETFILPVEQPSIIMGIVRHPITLPGIAIALIFAFLKCTGASDLQNVDHIEKATKEEKGSYSYIPKQLGFHYTIRNDSEEEVTSFIKWHKGDLNRRDVHGCTPLHYAAYWGNIGAVRALLHFSELNRDEVDNYQKTPLQLARDRGFIGIAQLLEKE